MRPILTVIFLLSLCFPIHGQTEFIPPVNNLDLSETYVDQVKSNVKSISKEMDGNYRIDLKKFYKLKYTMLENLAENEHLFFKKEWSDYLNSLANQIYDANPEWDFSRVQVVLSTYFWPNAFSVGEGTIIINPGIIPRLQNEDQLAFILCHEFSHYLLKHSENAYEALLKEMDSEELEEELEEINSSSFYQTTKLKRLLRSKLYESQRHKRINEIEADSLGFELMKNAGFDVNEALTTMQILDGLNHKVERDLDIKTLTNIDSVTIESSGILRFGENANDGWLEFDSVKSHPDCEHRFGLMAKQTNHKSADFKTFKAKTNTNDAFARFRSDMRYFLVEAYKFYDRYDLALLTVWDYRQSGDDNRYLQKEEFHLISGLIYARKKHRIGHYCTYPNDSMEASHKYLTSAVYGMRYSELLDKLYPRALELYKDDFEDEESFYYRALLAYSKGDKEDLELAKHEYFQRFDRRTGVYYEEIRYLFL